MKRVIVVTLIMIGTIASCIYSYYRVKSAHEEVNSRMETITTLLSEKRRNEYLAEVNDFCSFWEDESGILVHHVRHSQIDDISKSVSRLQALAAYELYGDFMAEITTIQDIMDHILESEQPVWDSFL